MFSPSESTAALTSNAQSLEAPRRKASGNFLRQARLLHLYLGTFFAPCIIFFSLTGAAQVISLHEATPGSSYKPPLWMEKLAQVHKKQTLVTRPKGGGPPRRAVEIPPGEHRSVQPRNTPQPVSIGTALLKWFFLLMSLGLTITTILGIYMAFKYNRNRRLVWGMLVIGTALPVGFLFM